MFELIKNEICNVRNGVRGMLKDINIKLFTFIVDDKDLIEVFNFFYLFNFFSLFVLVLIITCGFTIFILG
jgi:hypothetical protein